ncbi:YggT family protein [Neisseria yangbaofengii]|uniref:YggT family protein n=1 Tax=Neisseria yangbaofengii TaxID=2709396 RepID=UPI0013ECBAC1|nr:YggT family protein [Neisseria yangbaofengii]
MKADLLLLLADGLVIVMVARCLLHWAKLEDNHPLAAFCRQTTDWLVNPLRKAAPAAGWDTACLLAGLLVYYIAYMVVAWVELPGSIGGKIMAANFIFALIGMLKAVTYALLFGLIIRMLLSFQNPYSPLVMVLQRIFEPVSRPFAFLRIGRYDFSGSLVALVLWFLLVDFLPKLVSSVNLWLLR